MFWALISAVGFALAAGASAVGAPETKLKVAVFVWLGVFAFVMGIRSAILDLERN